MPNQTLDLLQPLFQSRLVTLEHLLKTAQSHFGEDESFLHKRLVADMLPFGTQIVFTCNQLRNFALWCQGEPANNLEPEVTSLAQAYQKDLRSTPPIPVGLGGGVTERDRREQNLHFIC